MGTLYAVFLLAASIEAYTLYLVSSRPIVEAPIRPAAIEAWDGGGHAYSAIVRSRSRLYRFVGDSVSHPRQANLVLLENGKPLGPAHSFHEHVAKKGGGLYSYWEYVLIFSASDNSDPRTNGRVYSYRVVRTPSALLYATLGAVTVGFVLVFLLLARRLLFLRTLKFAVPLKFMGLATIFVFAPWLWWGGISAKVTQMFAAGEWRLGSAFILGAIFSLIALLLVPFFRDRWVRLALAVFVLAGFAIDQVMLEIARHHLTLDMMEVLWRNRNMAPDAAYVYSSAVAKAALLVGVLFLIMVIAPPPKWAVRTRFAIIPVITFAFVYAMVSTSHGRIESFPSPFAVPAQLLTLQTTARAAEEVDRWPVNYSRPIAPLAKKLVMVVDESVRGDYLQLNDKRFDNTPFLLASAGNIANFGVAISGANCSEASRLFMRIGLRPSQLPDTLRVWTRVPSIWQYAKKAGYRTVLIDSFRYVGHYHSYMNRKEAEFIDSTISVASLPYPERDRKVAEELVNLLKSDEPLFIYVNKLGMHPPYNHMFPENLPYNASFIGPTLVYKGSLKDYQKAIVAQYHKALRWSVDMFFETVMPAALKSDATLLYTSDHGQSMFEGGYDISHCTVGYDTTRGEVFVPLFGFSGDRDQQARLQAAAKASFNKASHFEVFPTLLNLMGYADDWSDVEYGPNLFNIPKNRERGFLQGLFDAPNAAWMDAEYPPVPPKRPGAPLSQ